MACRPAIPSRSGLAEVGRAAFACRSANAGPAAQSLCAGAWPALSATPVAWTALLCPQSVQLARCERVEPTHRADQQGAFWSGVAQTLTEQCRLALVALQHAAGSSAGQLSRALTAHPVGRCHPSVLPRQASRDLALALCLRSAGGTAGLGTHQYAAGG